MAEKSAISPRREENYPEWYQQVVKAGELAESSPVRGCMVIKPWGYGIWERIQRELDDAFKATGHKNAYFPLFIPKSFLEKEAEHVEGFAKECAVVTHHRLEEGPDGGLVPAGELEEPLIVRPTSETIIGAMYSKWVQSYRDLPVLINQWANVVRWEMRTRMFLRTTEFLWQEGHTAHATKEEAMEETLKMLEVYRDFAENCMAMPVICGEKTEGERFPGAVSTYSIEAMMQDRKALQAGTSHFLGQNFSKASNIQFLSAEGKQEYAWTTSWGVSTRLIGGMIMTHSDDDGLKLPPALAPAHAVILPVLHKEESRAAVLEFCHKIKQELSALSWRGCRITVEVDDRDLKGGEKNWSWIKKGIPIRMEVGPRDLESDSVFLARRDLPHREKKSVSRAELTATLPSMLEEIQNTMFENASSFQRKHTREIHSESDFRDFYASSSKNEIHGGFAIAHYSGEPELEARLQEEMNVTVRNIPLKDNKEEGVCIFTGKPSKKKAVFAKAY